MRGRLFERFQQRVERGRRQHVDLVDDVDLRATARRRELHAPDDLLAHVLDARAARRVELVDVRMGSVGYFGAVFAGSIGLGRRALLAQKRLCKQARRRGFARAARTGEQVGVADLILLDRVLDRALDMLLAHHIFEDLGAVFSVQCLCHAIAFSYPRICTTRPDGLRASLVSS